MRKTFVVVLAFAASAALAQQPDYSKVEVKAIKVSGTVYMLSGAGGNIGVSAGEDGIVIVDDQFAPLAPKIKAALAGISDKPIKFILNTHYHGDHTGGNEVFGREARTSRRRTSANGCRVGRSSAPARRPPRRRGRCRW